MPTQPSEPPEPIAVTVAEAARLLGLSAWSVYELIKAGRLPSFKVGRAVRVPVAALHQLANGTPAEEIRP